MLEKVTNMSKKKILITAGGTGGHLFPAQGLAKQLTKSNEILFVAGGLGKNRYFDSESFPYREINTPSISTKNPFKLLMNIFGIAQGVIQTIRIMKKFKPDVVVGFGSFYTIPVLLAAKMKKIPIVLHESNSLPGKANRWFSSSAKAVGVHFPFTKSVLKGNVIVVPTPLRDGYSYGTISKNNARNYFQLDPEMFTLLIFGGSQGALGINRLIQGLFQNGFDKKLQVIHLIGNHTSIEEFESLYHKHGVRSSVKRFEPAMNIAWQAADLFIGRSGASSIAEATEFQVPGILIPYPYATENHQEKNADFYVNEVKGGVKLLEGGLTATKLKETIVQMSEAKVLNGFSQSIQAYKSHPSHHDLAHLVLDIANNKKGSQ